MLTLRAPRLASAALALALALGASPGVRAAGEYLVQDLGQTALPSLTEGWFPPFWTELDGVAYFFRDDGIHGRELWRTDGTTPGTFLLRDICPGVCGAEAFYGFGGFDALGPLVFFPANDGVHGTELWATDGTAAGTRLVADLQPGPRSSEPVGFHAAFGLVWFVADDGVHGRELWRSDGTPAGTWLVLDAVPGPGSSGFRSITSGNGLLWVRTDGDELWRSDGTPAGTFLLHDTVGYPNLFELKGEPSAFLPDGTLVFTGCDSTTFPQNCELWRTDGTLAGTTPVADLFPGPESSYPGLFFAVGSEIWFSAEDAATFRRVLYRTDGTPGGTQPIPTPAGLEVWTNTAATVLGDSLVFAGCEQITDCEPWITDGVTTTRLGDLWPGSEASLRGSVALDRPLFATVGGLALFPAEDPTFGLRLWRTDGTPGGTLPVSDLGGLPTEATFGYFQAFVEPTVLGDRLLLFPSRPGQGIEIWSSDGTAAGTALLATVGNQSSAFLHPTNFLYTIGGRRCFAPLRQGVALAAITDPAELASWLVFSDGVPDGVELLAPIVDRFTPGVAECAANGKEVLAVGATLAESGIWRTDGTAAGTALLLPALDPYSIASVPVFERFGDELFFGLPFELDAVPPGATDPSEIRTLVSSLSTGTLKGAGERLFYGGWEGLEVTDGVADPILLIPPPDPPDYRETGDLVAAGDILYFTVDSPATGVELWRSDGTPTGSGLVVDLRPGPQGSLPRRELRELFNRPWEERIASLGPDFVVFPADDGAAGTELWASDGTAAGTVLIADLDPGPDGSWPRHLVGAGDGVAYFAAEHPELGLELYRTDGTAAGTRMVRDLVVGPGSSVPEELTIQDGILYFSAWTPAHGRELWRSDGSFEGTYRLTDVAPGPLSSSPDRILRRGDRLFFVATDHVHGFELWARADDGSLPLFLDGFETGDTSRWSLALP